MKTANNSKHEQMVDELVRVLDLRWRGDVAHFDAFAKTYLTSAGRTIAEKIGPTENVAHVRAMAHESLSAGY